MTEIDEAGPSAARIQHPEDLIYWEGSSGALKALYFFTQAIKKPNESVSVKWDGSPAVIFGINEEGKFFFTDKSGFTAKTYNGKATSPEEIEAIFNGRLEKTVKDKESYKQLVGTMKSLFVLFEKATPKGRAGYFKGDLLYSKKPQVSDGSFVFKPNITTYSVGVDTELGKQIDTSSAGVVIHTFTDLTTGNTEKVGADISRFGFVKQPNGLLIFSPIFLQTKPTSVKVPELAAIKKLIQNNQGLIDATVDSQTVADAGIPEFADILYRYTNSKAGNFSSLEAKDFQNWMVDGFKGLSNKRREAAKTYIQNNLNGIDLIFSVVKSIEGLKNKLVGDFDSENIGIKASAGDTGTGEGYVISDPKQGLVKLVNRGGFTVVNRAIVREEWLNELFNFQRKNKSPLIAIYPGAFKPYHAGHDKVVRAAASEADIVYLFVSNKDRVRPGEFPLVGSAMEQVFNQFIIPSLPKNVKVSFVPAPVTSTYDLITSLESEAPNTVVYLIAGDEDRERFKDQYLAKAAPKMFANNNIQIGALERDEFSGTKTRTFLANGDVKMFIKQLPKSLYGNGQEIFDILTTAATSVDKADKPAVSKKPSTKKKIKEEKMATTKIKMSDLRALVTESVRKHAAKKMNESWKETMEESEEDEEMTMEEISEMIDSYVAEAFGEKGDHGDMHLGGTFGDGGEEKGPLEEGKKKKKGLPPALKKNMEKKKEEKKDASKKK